MSIWLTLVTSLWLVIIGVAVLVIGLARDLTLLGRARHRAAEALRLRSWPQIAVVGLSAFAIILGIGGVIMFLSSNPLVVVLVILFSLVAIGMVGFGLTQRR